MREAFKIGGSGTSSGLAGLGVQLVHTVALVTVIALTVLCFASGTALGEDKPGASKDKSAAAEIKPGQWRGVHIMAWGLAGGPDGLQPLKEAVTKVFHPAGVNVIILEVGYNFEYQKHPELRQTKFITKKDAQDLVAHCRQYGIRVIPQFNCVGHQSWRNILHPLLTQYREFEEPPDVPPGQRWTALRSWCPLHPEVNPIVFSLIDELIDAFSTDAFHVGMDEILVIASKKCERCRDKTPAEVLAKAINDLHQHIVQERGLTMLMWGDRLLDGDNFPYGPGWETSRNGTAPAIDLIPKDIIICDWHYGKRPEYPSVAYFQEKGFRVWPAGWSNPDAVRAMIRYSRQHASDRMLGYLATSWVLEPGGFCRALLGETHPALVSQWARDGAAGFRAAIDELNKPVATAQE